MDEFLKNRLKRYQIPPSRFRFRLNAHGDIEEFFVIARTGNTVLFYQEIEEEFGIGTFNAEGVVEDWGTYPSLHVAVSNFPSRQGAG